MRINLYYSKTKRYLRGNDWVICALDHLTRRTTGAGNLSQVVLQLAGTIRVEELRAHLREFLAMFPAVGGRPARDLINLAPYWRMRPSGRTGPDPILAAIRHDGGSRVENVFGYLEGGVNSPFPDRRQHLAFQLVTGFQDTTYLGMTFDHRLLDARGAEMFLQLFQYHHENPDQAPSALHTTPTEPAHLSEWIRKFRSGKHVNRAILGLSRLDLAALQVPPRQPGLAYRFRVSLFDEQQSSRIVETAYRKAGYLLVMPHLLAATVRALHPIFRKRGSSGTDYVAVVSLDGRKPSSRDEKLFFNHLSFFFFRIGAFEANNHKAVVESIKTQMYSQVKSRQPQHLDEASMLMRILPLRALGALMRRPLRGMMGSFGFSHVGETAYTSREFMGLEVSNLFHMPRVAAPPGIGIFFNQFRKRINMTLSYIEGIFEEADADCIVAGLNEILTGGCDRVADHGRSM